MITTFALLGLTACAASSDADGGAAPSAAAPKPTAPEMRNMAAWLDKMPIEPPRMHVKAEVYVSNGGKVARLIRANSPSANPALLALDLTVTQKPGPATQAFTWVEARYDESPARAEYTQVEIRFEGKIVQRIKVEVVH